jgi:hypothetical protein
MTIKVIYRDVSTPVCCTLQDFMQTMGIAYFPELQFETLKTLEGCRRRAARSGLDARQKWLGSYYAKELSRPAVPDITIQWLNETLGYGVLTNVPIAKGAFIGEYTGLVCKQRWVKKIKNYYCFDYTFISGTHNSPYLIDGEKQGNFIRYINHSDDPNLETSSVFHNGLMHIILYAIKEIPAGTQLCYDYGGDYWKKRDKPCRL